MGLTEPNNKNFLTFGTSRQFITKLFGFILFLLIISFVLKETALIFTLGAGLIFLALAALIPWALNEINNYTIRPFRILKFLFILIIIILAIGAL
ncbi:hypothetical protein D6745_01505 [Candidatus Woesearchaeota archaeon]|nr:MAG: hypothetical protein D6745_01505 [Candidatus Woesearchaeota archaeon]